MDDNASEKARLSDIAKQAVRDHCNVNDVPVGELSFGKVCELAVEATLRDQNPAPAVTCGAKHAPYQPDNSHWRCPKCGDKTGDFVVLSSPDDANENCTLLHVGDECECSACGYRERGSRVAAALAKVDNVEACATCGGRGVVPKGASDDGEVKVISRRYEGKSDDSSMITIGLSYPKNWTDNYLIAWLRGRGVR